MLWSQNSQGSSLKPSRICFFTCRLFKQYRMSSPIPFKTQELNVWVFFFHPGSSKGVRSTPALSSELFLLIPQESWLRIPADLPTGGCPGARQVSEKKTNYPHRFFHICAQMVGEKMEHISLIPAPNSLPERGTSKRCIFKPPCPHVLRALLSPCILKQCKSTKCGIFTQPSEENSYL